MKDEMMKGREEESSLMGKLSLYLVAAVLLIVPFIMKAHIYDPKLNSYPWFSDTNFEVDIFLYYKGVILVSLAAIMFLILPYFLYKNRQILKGEIWLYPLFGYAFFAIISTVLSPFRSFGFTGIYEQHESLQVLLAYVIVTLFSYFSIKNEASIHFFIKVLFVLGLITSFLGISQLIGKDFFETDFAKALMIPSAMEEEFGFRENLHFKFSGSGNHQVYLTMYNPNYVGVFSALIFPIFTSLSFGMKEKGKKILWGSLAIINFIIAMGSGSKTFLGSFVVSGLVALFIYKKQLKKGLRLMAVFVLALIFLTSGYFYYIKINPIAYVKNALNTTENQNRIQDLSFFSDRAELVYNGEKLILSFEKGKEKETGLIIKNEAGTELRKQKIENADYTIDSEAYKDVKFGIYEYGEGENISEALVVTVPEGPIRIGKGAKGYFFLTSVLKADEIVNAAASVIVNHDAFASGRGYIWSRTFPVMKNHLVLGSGADTFLLAFPQNDYIGKLNGGFGSMIISKPHNLYLQIGVQTGVLSLICYLILGLLFVVQGIFYYSRTEMNSLTKVLGSSLVLGVIGYFISGIFNDSVLAVAPIFWVLLGLGYGILFFVKREEKEER